MKKNKPRWKDLPFYERFARTCKRNGSADWMVEHIRERGKQKEKEEKITSYSFGGMNYAKRRGETDRAK